MNAPIRFPLALLANAVPNSTPAFIAAVTAQATPCGNGFVEIDGDVFEALRVEHVPPLTLEESREPTVAQMATNFVGAMAMWAKAGFPVADKAVYEKREPLCLACDKYKKILGLYHGCSICGCTTVKLHLATSKCPLGKW